MGVAFTGQLKLLAQWQALDPNRKEVQDTRQGTRMAVDAVVASIKRRAQTITTFEDIAEVHVRSFHSCISFILSIFYLF